MATGIEIVTCSSDEGSSDEELNELLAELEDVEESSTNDLCKICAGALEPNPSLCGSCQIWNDARHVFRCMDINPNVSNGNPDSWDKCFRWVHHTSSVPYTTLACQKNCLICQATANGLKEKYRHQPSGALDLSSLKVLTCGPYHTQLKRAQPRELRSRDIGSCEIRCVVFIVTAKDPETHLKTIHDGVRFWQPWPQTVTGLQVKLHYHSCARELTAVTRWEAPLANLLRLKGQIEGCEKNHGSTCKAQTLSLPQDFRLVDCERLCIITLSTAPVYAALSYSWKNTQSEQFQELNISSCKDLHKPGGIKASQVPKLIWDAINLCTDLGAQFLWVDRLCVIQDDKTSKTIQIMAMDQIYQGAKFTIVAAVDSHRSLGLPGVRGRPRQPSLFYQNRLYGPYDRCVKDYFKTSIDNSQWNSRAWTYEERLLSRRCIYVTNDAMRFDCMESRRQGRVGSDWGGRIPDFMTCIGQYSSRHLTHNTDILHAFAGMGNALEAQLQTEMLYGLPVRELPHALLWTPLNVMSRRDDMPDIPSWSWAGWNGAVWYHTKFAGQRWGSIVGSWSVAEDSKLRELDVKETWFNHDQDFEEMVKTEDLPPKWPEYSPYVHDAQEDSAKVWKECLQNPWKRELANVVDVHFSSNLALSVPDALVFETTSASLYLGRPYRAAYEERNIHASELDIIELTISNEDGKVVGTMMDMQTGWIDALVNRSQKQDFIVICAGAVFGESEYGRFGGDVFDPWLLHVMLVLRKAENSSICSRVAIGTIETRCWKECKPRWETIALT